MTVQVLFFNVFSEKDPHLNAVENAAKILTTKLDDFTPCDTSNLNSPVDVAIKNIESRPIVFDYE